MDDRIPISERLHAVLAAEPFQCDIPSSDLAALIEVPKDGSKGDFAFPCFTLAKSLRQAPPKIAAALAEPLRDALLDDPRYARIEAAGPYVNVTLDDARLFAERIPAILDGSFAAAGPPRGERVMIEYSQPNTHKAFHVGHTRNVSLGDACVRICRHAGFDVVAANYIGDVGTHIAKCLWYLREVHRGEIPEQDRGAFLGEMYAAADAMLDLGNLTEAPLPKVVAARVVGITEHPEEPKWKVVSVETGDGEPRQVVCGGRGFETGDLVAYAQVGARIGKRRIEVAERKGTRSEGMILSQTELGRGKDKEAIAILPADAAPGTPVAELFRKPDALDADVAVLDEIERRQQGVRDVLKALEAGEPELTALWKETRQWSLDEFQAIYDWLDATFDHFFYESDVGEEGKQIVLKAKEDGVLIESEGTIGADLSDAKLPFFMLLKSDGTGLYSTKDIALARRKFDEFHIDRSVYVVDASQSLHFQQVFKTLEKLGYERAKQCHHLAYGMVMVPDGKMSSRAGNVIPFVRLKHELIRHVREKFLDEFVGQWSADEIEETARRIAIATIRYGMLNQDNNKNIIFDLDEWTNPSGNTGPYLMYAYVRTRSILREIDGYALDAADWSRLDHVSERTLVRSLGRFPTVVEQAATQYEPQLLCIYLYDLSKDFSRFFRECSVKHAEDDALRAARAALTDAVGRVLAQGLGLLGIPVVERM